MKIRLPLLALTMVAATVSFGSLPAWADTPVDTTGCPTNGFAVVTSTGFPVEQNEVGNEFAAPAGTNYLKTFTAELAADGNQAATVAFYNADSSGLVGAPLFTAPVTFSSTGSVNTCQPHTFTVDQPVVTGPTYGFVITSTTPSANVDWATEDQSAAATCYRDRRSTAPQVSPCSRP